MPRRSSSTKTAEAASPDPGDFVERPYEDAVDPDADDNHHGYEEKSPPDGYVRPDVGATPPAETEED